MERAAGEEIPNHGWVETGVGSRRTLRMEFPAYRGVRRDDAKGRLKGVERAQAFGSSYASCMRPREVLLCPLTPVLGTCRVSTVVLRRTFTKLLT